MALLALGMSSQAHAQSKDVENPTPLTSNTLRGAMSEQGNLYYSFTAAPGDATVTVFLETPSTTYSVPAVTGELMMPNFGKSLCSATAKANLGRTDSQACSTPVKTEQRLILRIGLSEACKSCMYRVRVDGMRGGDARPAAPAATPAPAAPGGAAGSPSAGPGFRTMLIRLKDGTTMQIDLAKVADITYK